MRRKLVAAVVLTALAVTPAARAWTWPSDGPILRPFALGDDVYAGGQHRGVDIGADLGAIVRAPAAGTVSFVGPIPGGGRAVTIQTSDGYAVTLLQLGTTSVARGDEIAEGAVVGGVGQSTDAVTAAPHVHLGVRVAADPNGYIDPLGLLPGRPVVAAPAPAPAPAPEASPAAAPPVPAEPPPVAVPVPAAPAPDTVEVEAPAESTLQRDPPLASRPNPTADPPTASPSARPVEVKPVTRQPVTRQPVSQHSAPSRAALPTKLSGSVSAKPTEIAVAPSSPHSVGERAPAARAVRPGRRAPQAVASRPIDRVVFDRFVVPAARHVVERSDGGDPIDTAPVLMTIAASSLLVLGAWLARRRDPGTREAEKDARMMNRHERSASSPEDSRRGRVAVCERPATHRACGGIWGSGRHLRPLPPVAWERRSHGQRDGRARHAGHGRRRSSRSLTT